MVVPLRRITAKLDVPPVVEVPAGRETIEIGVRTELRNDTEDDFVLHAPTPDAAIFWQLLNDKHREIQRDVAVPKPRMAAPTGAVEAVSLTLASGHSEHETETLVLETKKLKPGVTYTVRAAIFGQVAEAEFVVIHTMPLTPLVPASQPQKKAKAAPAKKAAAKKAPPKKKGTAKAKTK